MIGNQLRYAVSTAHVQTMTAVDQVTATLRGVEPLSTGDIVCVVRYDVDGRMGQVAARGRRAAGDPAGGAADPALVRDLAIQPTRRAPTVRRRPRDLPVVRRTGQR